MTPSANGQLCTMREHVRLNTCVILLHRYWLTQQQQGKPLSEVPFPANHTHTHAYTHTLSHTHATTAAATTATTATAIHIHHIHTFVILASS